jgi:hypothetical protein
MNRGSALLPALFGALGLLLVGLPTAIFVRDLDHWRHWPHVEAQVLSYEQGSQSWRPVYGYTLQGRPIQTTPFWFTDDPGLDVGSRLVLAVDPAQPTDFQKAPGLDATYVVPFLIGAGFLLFALLFQTLGGAPEEGEASGSSDPDQGRTVAVPLLLKPLFWGLAVAMWLFDLEPPFGNVTGLALFFSFIAAGAAVVPRFEVAGDPLDAERLFGWGWVDPREPRDWHWAGALLLLGLGLRGVTVWRKRQRAAKEGRLGPGR